MTTATIQTVGYRRPSRGPPRAGNRTSAADLGSISRGVRGGGSNARHGEYLGCSTVLPVPGAGCGSVCWSVRSVRTWPPDHVHKVSRAAVTDPAFSSVAPAHQKSGPQTLCTCSRFQVPRLECACTWVWGAAPPPDFMYMHAFHDVLYVTQ